MEITWNQLFQIQLDMKVSNGNGPNEFQVMGCLGRLQHLVENRLDEQHPEGIQQANQSHQHNGSQRLQGVRAHIGQQAKQEFHAEAPHEAQFRFTANFIPSLAAGWIAVSMNGSIAVEATSLNCSGNGESRRFYTGLRSEILRQARAGSVARKQQVPRLRCAALGM